MTPPDQQVEKRVDHAAEARRWVDHAERRGMDDPHGISARTAFAQVHATRTSLTEGEITEGFADFRRLEEPFAVVFDSPEDARALLLWVGDPQLHGGPLWGERIAPAINGRYGEHGLGVWRERSKALGAAEDLALLGEIQPENAADAAERDGGES